MQTVPYNKLEGDNKEEHIYICEVCQQMIERPTDAIPKDWVVIWGATDPGAECYCPDHAQEGRARKDVR